MSYAICLDQNTPNFNINNLSANGFSIYANLGNGFNTVIAQGIPANLLFPFPNGTCPYNVTLPQGTTQILVVDQCNFELDVASVFSPENIAAGTITTTCCYAVIDIPQEPGPPPTFCETCTLTFDTFLTGTTGSITAGNLSSTCGPITDYTIGWYLNGNYSSPAITSGYGNTFTYQFQHPLTGNSAVPVLAGNWEGIIHDIIINGVTYSSVSGSAGGQSIPFESCFDTVVAAPLKCDNGAFQGIAKYTHQINFNSQAVGTTSAPVSLTYALDPTTKYFAYFFDSYFVSDEIEIKWKSGNPNATPNPSFYSQSIYLEKLKRGGDFPPDTNAFINPTTTAQLPLLSSSLFNNVWPKISSTSQGNNFPIGGFQRVLTLTSLPTSSNPLSPDLLEITIKPNPTNNNTQWKAAFQCLDNFDCTDCNFSNWRNSLPKISSLYLSKQYGCDSQTLFFNISGCLNNSDFYGQGNPLFSLSGSLIGPSASPSTGGSLPNGYLQLTPSTNCIPVNQHLPSCGPSSTGTITLNKTPQQIQLTFNLYSDFLYYKNNLINSYSSIFPSPPTSSVSCPAGTTNTSYYQYFSLSVPIQLSPSANCGDNTTFNFYYFHINDYFNVIYTNDNNPNATSWAITIPQSLMVNCYPVVNCNNCNSIINTFVGSYNQNVQNLSTFTFTTTVGAKDLNPFSYIHYIISQGGTAPSGSLCFFALNYNVLPWYSTHTIPFVSSPSSPTGWINLTSLSSSLPCNFNAYPTQGYSYDTGWFYRGYIFGLQARFPNLTGSFNYSLSTNDFELYAITNITNTGSLNTTPNQSPLLCPDPSGSKIYSYIGGVPTVYSASYFVGGSPILTIDP
jgi:hypothetical protein